MKAISSIYLVFGRIRFAHLYFCVVFRFVCLRSVSCLPNVANVFGLSILDGSFHIDKPIFAMLRKEMTC